MNRLRTFAGVLTMLAMVTIFAPFSPVRGAETGNLAGTVLLAIAFGAAAYLALKSGRLDQR